MKASSLTSLIFKELTGKEILPAQEAFLDEVALIVADFKYDLLEPPSSASVALSVACKKDLYQTLSNSMGLWGDNHFVFSEVVRQWRTGDYPEFIAGMGHPKFKVGDPRTVEIERLAAKHNLVLPSSMGSKSAISCPINWELFVSIITIRINLSVSFFHTIYSTSQFDFTIKKTIKLCQSQKSPYHRKKIYIILCEPHIP